MKALRKITYACVYVLYGIKHTLDWMCGYSERDPGATQRDR